MASSPSITISDWDATTLDTFLVTISPHHRIKTLVTCDPVAATQFLPHLTQSPIIGLDIEWRPNQSPQTHNSVSTIQLSCSTHCLIFQLIHAPEIPGPLIEFLRDSNRRFVGVGVREDVGRLREDYGLIVGENVVELGDVVGKRGVGLRELGRVVVGIDVEKPKRVTMGKWDVKVLSYEQIQYACVDAFLSFEIGRRLLEDG
ncbi:hypothetical protein Droror1_Dr00012874 [Drosera rotundifolia]